MPSSDGLVLDEHFVELHEDEREFLTDLAVNESQRWIEAVTRNKFRSPDFLESLEDGVLLCELLECIWPRFIQLDDAPDRAFTRLYGQYTLEAFRGGAEKLGLDSSVIFLPKHIHAPERYICTADAQDAIQEALIRVTVTIYLLGWRAKETPTYTGPHLDLTAFTQLYQHYLHHLHNNEETLCNRIDKSEHEPDSLLSGGEDIVDDKENSGSPHEPVKMPGQVLCEGSEGEDPLSLSSKNSYDTEIYRGMKSGYYADSVGSSGDSACSSHSPSMMEPGSQRRYLDGHRGDELLTRGTRLSRHCTTPDPLQFVKPKDTTSSPPFVPYATSINNAYAEVDKMKQRIKDDEAEWQLNLDSWKSKRKTNVPVHELEEEKDTRDAHVKTFSEMVEHKRYGGFLAEYLDDTLNDEISVPKADKEISPVRTPDSLEAPPMDNFEKDSSSGISSPRSSRSLVSVSPPPSPAVQQLVSTLSATSSLPCQQTQLKKTVLELAVTFPRKLPAAPTFKRENQRSRQFSTESEDNLDTNPNIETNIKPFGEKLAMFQKVLMEEEQVRLDPGKCSYKEVAKPELSVKDKLSVFERPLEVTSTVDKKDSHPTATRVKSVRTAFETMESESNSSSTRSEPSGGISRLLSRDLKSNVQLMAPKTPVTEFEHGGHLFDSGGSNKYLQEIDGILGGDSGDFEDSLNDGDVDKDLPPPPLPSVPPPPVGELAEHVEREENEFPSPPPSFDSGQEQAASDSDPKGNSNAENIPFRRMDSTKRIKTELSKRRSDYFGIKLDSTDLPEPEKSRPQSFHELKSPKTEAAPVALRKMSSDVKPLSPRNREETVSIIRKTAVDAKPKPKTVEEDCHPLPSQESIVSTIIEEYKEEIRKEQIERTVQLEEEKREQPGILRNRPLKVEDNPLPKSVERSVPIAVSEEYVSNRPATKEKENVVIVDKVEKYTEEKRITGSFESTTSSSREEMRSLDYLTVSGRAPPHLQLPVRLSQIEKSPFSLQHYRDHSDGGYSSGRSDQGAGLVPHTAANLPLQRRVDVPSRDGYHAPQPSRPPLPSEFHPPPPFNNGALEPELMEMYVTHHSTNSAVMPPSRMQMVVNGRPERDPVEMYVTHHSTNNPVVPPTRMQMKVDPTRKVADVQQHWLVQEAEMRRLSEMDGRARGGGMVHNGVVPVPTILHKPPPFPVVESVHPREPMREIPANHLYQRRTLDMAAKHTAVVPQVHQLPTRTTTMIPVAVESRVPFAARPNPSQPSVTVGMTSMVPPRYPEVHYGQYPNGSPAYATNSYPQQTSPQQSQIPYPIYPPQHSVSQASLAAPHPKSFPVPHNGNTSRESPSDSVPTVGVSSKRRCAHCSEPLGRGAAMIVESLQLYYHVACFKCYVCGQALGNGREGADVRVRNAKLHCALCYSDEEDITETFSSCWMSHGLVPEASVMRYSIDGGLQLSHV